MIRASEFAINFLVNSAWQIIAIVFVALLVARLLNNAPARYRHWLWAAALLLSVALPLWSVVRQSAAPIQPTNADRIAPAIKSLERTRQNPAAHSNPKVALEIETTTPKASASWPNMLRKRSQSLAVAPTLLLLLSIGYALFIFFRLGRIWLLWRRTNAIKRAITPIEVPDRLREIAARCAAAVGLQKVPQLCSMEISAPGVVGSRTPVIILPENFFADLPDETLYSVLGHEMAHIARRDFQLNLLFEFLLLPISFHPLARFIKQQIDRTRELACDELVTETLLEPVTHARSLVRIAGALINPSAQALTLGIFDANILEERIMKLTGKTRRFGLRAGRLLTLTAISFLVFSGVAISTFSFHLSTMRTSFAATTLAGEQNNDVTPTQNNLTPVLAQNPTRSTAPANEPERMKSADAQARAQAACDAGQRGATEAIPQLVSMLGDDTTTELIRCWESGRWNPALATFKHASPGEQAAIALASMGSVAFEPLTNALSSSDTSVRRNAAWAIGELTNMAPGERSDAVLPLISMLGDPDSWVRMAAARALGELRDERASQRLIAALLDSDAGVREISAWSLGEMKDERAVQTLSDLVVSDRQMEVRLTAAEALGEIKDRKAIPSLTQALNDAEPRVRAKAKWAIYEIEDTDG